ncbi:hypothetical protein BKA70DRAFT_1562238 [Coprinopsis sp. MPI-PUGE-AT-0042]|nr:hypothetical protein BKA70DRAFT_1562238 [Coprinopsis sp. MPI-PUGE-AT-0042]
MAESPTDTNTSNSPFGPGTTITRSFVISGGNNQNFAAPQDRAVNQWNVQRSQFHFSGTTEFAPELRNPSGSSDGENTRTAAPQDETTGTVVAPLLETTTTASLLEATTVASPLETTAAAPLLETATTTTASLLEAAILTSPVGTTTAGSSREDNVMAASREDIVMASPPRRSTAASGRWAE